MARLVSREPALAAAGDVEAARLEVGARRGEGEVDGDLGVVGVLAKLAPALVRLVLDDEEALHAARQRVEGYLGIGEGFDCEGHDDAAEGIEDELLRGRAQLRDKDVIGAAADSSWRPAAHFAAERSASCRIASAADGERQGTTCTVPIADPLCILMA